MTRQSYCRMHLEEPKTFGLPVDEVTQHIGQFISFPFSIPEKEHGRYFGILESCPNLPWNNNTEITLNPGLFWSDDGSLSGENLKLFRQRVYDHAGYNGTKRNVLTYQLVIERGSKLVFPFSKFNNNDYSHLEIELSPKSPKPKWLQRFERFTGYQPEKILAYLDGFMQGNSSDQCGNDLAAALHRSVELGRIRDRLDYELIFRGFDVDELLEPLLEEE